MWPEGFLTDNLHVLSFLNSAEEATETTRVYNISVNKITSIENGVCKSFRQCTVWIHTRSSRIDCTRYPSYLECVPHFVLIASIVHFCTNGLASSVAKCREKGSKRSRDCKWTIRRMFIGQIFDIAWFGTFSSSVASKAVTSVTAPMNLMRRFELRLER